MKRLAMVAVWGLLLAALCMAACSGPSRSGGSEKKPPRLEKSKRSPRRSADAPHPSHSHPHLHPHKGSPHHHHDHPHPHMPGPDGHHHAY